MSTPTGSGAFRLAEKYTSWSTVKPYTYSGPDWSGVKGG